MLHGTLDQYSYIGIHTAQIVDILQIYFCVEEPRSVKKCAFVKQYLSGSPSKNLDLLTPMGNALGIHGAKCRVKIHNIWTSLQMERAKPEQIDN